MASSESLNDHGNVPTTGAPANVSSGGKVPRNPNDHEKLTRLGPRAIISGGVIAERNPNDHENWTTKAGPPGTISRDGVLKMNETQVQQGETSSSSDEHDQQFGGRGVYNDEQKKIENAAVIIGKTMTTFLTSFKPVPKSCTIYKVPENLKDAYEGNSSQPKLINIGASINPYNYRFRLMQTHKWRFFSRFLSSMNNTSSSTTAATTSNVAAAAESSSTVVATHSKKIECLFAALKKIEASSRACYSDQNITYHSSGRLY